MSTDAELLADYAQTGSQSAFAELVQRHVDLVYRAGLRHTGGDTTLAEEVAQAVFTTLALKARSLPRNTIPVAWLYATTRHHARNAVRARHRRWVRENTAYLMQPSTSPDTSIEWERLRPAIDGAMQALAPDDREALHLRFFDRTSFAQLGALFQISEEAARKRVDRALEKLRARLGQRGITSTAAAVTTLLAAQTAPAAPATLTANIAGIALTGAAAAGSAMTGATFFGLMSTTKLSLGAAGLVAVLATGLVWHKQQQLRAAETALHVAQQQEAVLKSRVAALEARPASATPIPASAPAEPLVQASVDIADRVANLKEMLARRPDQQIPEIKLVLDVQWIVAANRPIASEQDQLAAFLQLRSYGKVRFGELLLKAVADFSAANEGRLPPEVLALAPYLPPPGDSAMLQRYQVIRTGSFAETPPGLTIISELPSPIAENDSLFRISKQSSSIASSLPPEKRALEHAVDAFIRANNGQEPTDPSQLTAHLPTAPDAITLENFWVQRIARQTGQRVRMRVPSPP